MRSGTIRQNIFYLLLGTLGNLTPELLKQYLKGPVRKRMIKDVDFKENPHLLRMEHQEAESEMESLAEEGEESRAEKAK